MTNPMTKKNESAARKARDKAIRQMARHRVLIVSVSAGEYSISDGQADVFGPADFAATRAWLLQQPTMKSKMPTDDVKSVYARQAHDYWGPIYDPEEGEPVPDGLVGLMPITIRLPPGASADDALRGLYAAENTAKRRGAPAVVAKLEEARAMLNAANLVPVRVIVSDHDLRSIEATGDDAAMVLLAAWLARALFVRGRCGRRRSGVVAVEIGA